MTRINVRDEHRKYANVEYVNIVLKGTFLSFRLNRMIENIFPKDYRNLSFPKNSEVNPNSEV